MLLLSSISMQYVFIQFEAANLESEAKKIAMLFIYYRVPGRKSLLPGTAGQPSVVRCRLHIVTVGAGAAAQHTQRQTAAAVAGRSNLQVFKQGIDDFLWIGILNHFLPPARTLPVVAFRDQ